MRLTLRFIASMGALMGIYLAAVLQSGPEAVDANLCKIARRFFHTIPDQCIPAIDVWGAGAAIVLFAFCALMLICDGIIWRRGRRKASPPKHGGQFSEIMEAIWWIAERSAWGRWQTAQGGMRSEIHKLHNAEHMLRTSAENGEIVINGRIAGTIKYEPIDQHFWRLVFFDIQPDEKTLWRASLKPRTGVLTPIQDFDSLIVRRADLESLPWISGMRLEWEIIKLTIRAKLRWFFGYIKSRMEPTHIIIAGLLIALIGAGWQLFRGTSQATLQTVASGQKVTVATNVVRAPPAEVVANIKAPLQAEIDALKQQLAQQKNSTSRLAATNQAPSAPKKYTTYEKEQRLRAADEIYEVIVAKLTPAYTRGRDLFNNLKAEVTEDTAAKNLRIQYQITESAFSDFKVVLQKYDYMSDLVDAARKNNFNGLTLMTACDNMISEIQYLKNLNPNVVAYLDRDIIVFEGRNSIREFETFLNETKPRVKQKRAEYEAAEIYEAK